MSSVATNTLSDCIINYPVPGKSIHYTLCNKVAKYKLLSSFGSFVCIRVIIP